jgi:hypothetical protein
MGYTWIVAGVGWGVTVIGWLLSPLISQLVNKFFPSPADDTSRKLRDLEVHTIPDLKLTLRNAEEQRMLRAAQEKGSESDLMTLEQLTQDLKSALYEAEDILDLIYRVSSYREESERRRRRSSSWQQLPAGCHTCTSTTHDPSSGSAMRGQMVPAAAAIRRRHPANLRRDNLFFRGSQSPWLVLVQAPRPKLLSISTHLVH